MDPSVTPAGRNETIYGGADAWAASSYALNNYVFGNPPRGVTYAHNSFASIVDGLSNTVFLAEVYGTCGNGGNINGTSEWGSLWADSNSIWRPAYNLGASKAGTNVTTYPPSPLPQNSPNFVTTCNPLTVQSNHTGGLNVCMGDGSVHFIVTSVTQNTWAAANDLRDGTVVGSDFWQ